MVGIDLIKIKRIKKLIDRFSDRGLKRFLTQDEISLCKSIDSIAGFWAAKEAASKALGTGIGAKCGFLDINIKKSSNGVPILSFSKKVCKEFGIKRCLLSISHDSKYAVAVVIIKTRK